MRKTYSMLSKSKKKHNKEEKTKAFISHKKIEFNSKFINITKIISLKTSFLKFFIFYI